MLNATITYILFLLGRPVGITSDFSSIEEKFEDGEVDTVRKGGETFQEVIDTLAPYATNAKPVSAPTEPAKPAPVVHVEPKPAPPTPMSSLDMVKALVKEYKPIVKAVLPKITAHKLFPEVKKAFIETFGTTYKSFVKKLLAEINS